MRARAAAAPATLARGPGVRRDRKRGWDRGRADTDMTIREVPEDRTKKHHDRENVMGT